MQTLTFNTTLKNVKLTEGPKDASTVIETFGNISTVKVGDGFYEIMQRVGDETSSAIPVMRVPISNTNMFIVK